MCTVVLHKNVTKIYAESIASVYSTPGGEGGTTGLRVRGWGSNLDDWRGSLFTLPVSSHIIINSSASGAGTKLRKSIKIVNPLPHGVLATFNLTAGGLLRPPEEGDISREKTILMTSLQVL
jgi:hypothetical protein